MAERVPPQPGAAAPGAGVGVEGLRYVEAARWFETSDSLVWIFLFCISLQK